MKNTGNLYIYHLLTRLNYLNENHKLNFIEGAKKIKNFEAQVDLDEESLDDLISWLEEDSEINFSVQTRSLFHVFDQLNLCWQLDKISGEVRLSNLFMFFRELNKTGSDFEGLSDLLPDISNYYILDSVTNFGHDYILMNPLKNVDEIYYLKNQREVYKLNLTLDQYYETISETLGFRYWQLMFVDSTIYEAEALEIEESLSFLRENIKDVDYTKYQELLNKKKKLV